MLHFLKRYKKKILRVSLGLSAFFAICMFMVSHTFAADGDGNNNLISIGISSGEGSDMASVLQMLLVLTVLSLAPSILMMLTSFTRIVIVLHFTRAAIGTQTVYTSAVVPLTNNEITAQEAFDIGVVPVRKFMLKQVSTKDLDTFLKIADFEEGSVKSEDDIPLQVLIPSFIVSELRIAFIIGFLIYLPFIVIDMVVSSTLMSMGMMMLPPTTISTPFKILLFVMADGWNLIIGNLMSTFN